MKAPVWSMLLIATLFATSLDAVTIDTVPVGNAGNPPDFTGFGSVAHDYRIGRTEVTNAQYVEFLNAVDGAGSNPLGLYNPHMTSFVLIPGQETNLGGINLNANAANGAKYEIKPGFDNKPVIWVSWYDTIRFANWLHNGGGVGDDTETGAYTLGTLGPGGVPIDGASITRNPGAQWFLPSEDEWYKAAYHKNDGVTSNYWRIPTSTDDFPSSAAPPGDAAPDPSNTVNVYIWNGVEDGYSDGFAVTGESDYVYSTTYLTDVGAYTSATSPYGTFDQAGNVWEWNETSKASAERRGVRGAGWGVFSEYLLSEFFGQGLPIEEVDEFGFRVARTAVPEPCALLLAAQASVLFLAHRRRACD